jgi:hypothetical protein
VDIQLTFQPEFRLPRSTSYEPEPHIRAALYGTPATATPLDTGSPQRRRGDVGVREGRRRVCERRPRGADRLRDRDAPRAQRGCPGHPAAVRVDLVRRRRGPSGAETAPDARHPPTSILASSRPGPATDTGGSTFPHSRAKRGPSWSATCCKATGRSARTSASHPRRRGHGALGTRRCSTRSCRPVASRSATRADDVCPAAGREKPVSAAPCPQPRCSGCERRAA